VWLNAVSHHIVTGKPRHKYDPPYFGCVLNIQECQCWLLFMSLLMMLGMGIVQECESEMLHVNELAINLFVNWNVKTNRRINICCCGFACAG
jgi:hypothetical protein